MGDQLLTAIVGGVIGALIATFLMLVGGKYWKEIIVPWYEDKIYKDIRIAGDWKTLGDEDGIKFNENAKIQQKAHCISGEIIYKTESEVNEYEFEGEFKNLILTARYWVKGESNLDRGTFTLMLRNNGRMLKGFYAWYLDDRNGVVSGSYEWTKP